MLTSVRMVNITDTVYDASMPVEEVGYAQGTNTPYVSAMYLIGPRGPEYRRDVVHQSVAWYVYDGLGSIVEEVDPSGNITAARKYDVYGMVRSGQAGSSSQKYVGGLGHESDGSTGLIYMRARYMDPVLGRFISEDPSKDGGNWFVYCGDEPIKRVDPQGTNIFDFMNIPISDTGIPDPVAWFDQAFKFWQDGELTADEIAREAMFCARICYSESAGCGEVADKLFAAAERYSYAGEGDTDPASSTAMMEAGARLMRVALNTLDRAIAWLTVGRQFEDAAWLFFNP
jgi:RHS repeat-associated protein